MTQYRKFILLGILGLMVLYFACDWLWRNVIDAPLAARRSLMEKLQKDIKVREQMLARARSDRALVMAWEARSLPANPEVARSLYQGWLLELISHVGFTSPSVNSGSASGRPGLYQAVSFSVRARGTLAQLTKFLFEFYNAGHLHQIRSLGITPIPRTNQLDLSMTIEGLILPSSSRRDQLSGLRYNRLAFSSLDDYRVIADRNFFSAGADAADPTDFTFLTAVNYVDRQPEAWFTLRAEDKVLKLHRGDPIEVGQFRGTIAEVEDSDVVVESEGQRWLLTVGDALAQAFALPPGM